MHAIIVGAGWSAAMGLGYGALVTIYAARELFREVTGL